MKKDYYKILNKKSIMGTTTKVNRRSGKDEMSDGEAWANIVGVLGFLAFAGFLSMYVANFVFVHVFGTGTPIYILLCFGGLGVFVAIAYIYAKILEL